MKGGGNFASVILLDNMQNLNLTTGNVRSPTKGQSTKLWLIIFKSVSVMKVKERLKNYFQTEGDIHLNFQMSPPVPPI